jgi:hypothetical protein
LEFYKPRLVYLLNTSLTLKLEEEKGVKMRNVDDIEEEGTIKSYNIFEPQTEITFPFQFTDYSVTEPSYKWLGWGSKETTIWCFMLLQLLIADRYKDVDDNSIVMMMIKPTGPELKPLSETLHYCEEEFFDEDSSERLAVSYMVKY